MSLPKYPAYKDSGVEWLGQVPAHWHICKIKRLSPVQRGASPRPIDDPKYFDDCGEYSWVRIADVSASNGTLSETTQRMSELGANLSVKIAPGELFVSIAGTVGKPCIATIKACIHDGFVYFPRLKINPKFLYRVFEAGTCYGGLGKFGTQLNLNTDTIGTISMATPPEDEVEEILKFLDRETTKIDALIAEQEKLIALLAEKRQATISHAVTRGLNPAAPMKDSGVEWLGQVPAHWEVKRLKTISPRITVGIVVNPSEYVSDEGLPFIYGGDISEGHISIESARRITASDSLQQEKTRLQPGDLLTVRVGAPGVTAVVPESCAGGNCASVMLIRRGNFDSKWLCFAMNSRMIRFQVEGVQYGAAQEQFNISHAINFWLAVPPQAEQHEISKQLEEGIALFDELHAKTTSAINLLKERRAALIAAAVTGQIDVRDLVDVPPEAA